jgi:predicted transcriptional regulator
VAKAKVKKADKKAVKEDEFANPAAIAKLTPAQYWEWRTSLEELSHEDTRVEVARLRQRIAELKVSEAQLEAKVADVGAREAQIHRSKLNADFHQFRERLEKELGISLRNCTIHPYSYEVTLHDTKEA